MAPPDDPVLAGLQCYVVGGAVRDALLGRPAGDRDWVVVGATPEAMVARGFVPVGDDFPVFLHPRTHEEFALARTERKSGRGYHGFVFHAGPEVTLEDDLRRRDLTVNAMARDAAGQLIDPLGGLADLRARVLRHVGPAFAEDPVRLLRLARFAARFGDFSVADETLALGRRLVDEGEVDALVPERVWQEFAKGLMTEQPQRMLALLDEVGALARLAPPLVWDAAVAEALHCAARRGLSLAQRHAVLWHASPPRADGVLKAPSACHDLARLLPGALARLARPHDTPAGRAWTAVPLTEPDQVLALLEACDGLRRPERCLDLLQAAGCVCTDLSLAPWAGHLQAVRGVDAGAIARAAGGDVERLRAQLHAARCAALQARLAQRP